MDELYRRILSRCAGPLALAGLLTLTGCASTRNKPVTVDPPAKKSLSDADSESDTADGDRGSAPEVGEKKSRDSASRLEVAAPSTGRAPARNPAPAPRTRGQAGAPNVASADRSAVPGGKSSPPAKQKTQEEFDPGEEEFDPGDLDAEPAVSKKPAAGPRTASASATTSQKKVVPAVKRDGSADAPLPEDEQPLTNLNTPLVFEGAGITFKKGKVAATVNGQPIFAEDILRQVPLDQAQRLDQAAQQLSPEDFNELQRQVIQMNLKPHIDRELLLQALKTKIKEDVLKNIQKQIDIGYNSEYLPHVMKLANAETESEFDEILRKQGSSLETLRTQYRNKEMAQQFLGSKAMPKSGFDRPDILRYYQAHKEDYAIHAQAKWEQINLKFASNGGPEATRRKAQTLLKRLDAGEDFGEIAKEFSNGPMASKGGTHGWTTEGSLANKGIEQALYELPLGEISDPIESKDAIDIIRVVDRTDSAYQPFAAVQEDIKIHLKNLEWQKATKALLEDLYAKATIESLIDKQ